MNGNDNFEDIFLNGISGIKRKRKRKRVSPFNPEDGIISDSGGDRVFVPGHGIFEGDDENEFILACGHPASLGIGHKADCGHFICRWCLEHYPLVCAEHGCFGKFCTARRCRNKPHPYAGLPFCLKHKTLILIEMSGTAMFSGSQRAREIMKNMREEYYLMHFQINKQGGENGGQKFPKQFYGARGPAEKKWPA